MILGKRGYELIRKYEEAVSEEARLVCRLDVLLQGGCRDLGLIIAYAQEVAGAHQRSVNICMQLQRYRLERNLGHDPDAECI